MVNTLRGTSKVGRFCRYILTLLTLVASALQAQVSPRGFERLGSAAGLSHNSVLSIAEDRAGFLWIGTVDGLNRYDGYEFLTFRHDPADFSTLSNNLVRAVLEDDSGALWVGTEDGLNRFDRRVGSFERYPLRGPGEAEVTVHRLLGARDGTVWAGTSRGLFRYQRERDRFEPWASDDPDDPARLEQSDTFGIQEDSYGALWVLAIDLPRDPSRATLHRLDPVTGGVVRYPLSVDWGPVYTLLIDSQDRIWINGSGPGVLAGELTRPLRPESATATTPIWSLLEDRNGALWVGSEAGLFQKATDAETVMLVDNDLQDRGWLRSFVLALHQDRSGSVWIGTLSGLYRLDPQAKPFRLLRHDPANPATLSNDAISALFEDRSGVLWVGTFGGGLNRVDRHGAVVRYRYSAADPGSLCNDLIWALAGDGVRRLWIGTEHGLCSLDIASGRFRRHELPRPTPGLSDLRITYVSGPHDDVLWLGSFEGLFRYEIDSGRADHFPMTGDAAGLSDRQIISLSLAAPDTLWIGTVEGVLDRFDIASGRFRHYPLATATGERINTEGIFDIHFDPSGSLWLGTGSGLSRFDPEHETFVNFYESHGLPGSIVYSVLEDERGRPWLGTNQGISRFDPRAAEGARFRNFGEDEGVGSTEFNRHAVFAGASGLFHFGGLRGVTSFRPEEIRQNDYVPPLAVTRIQTSNREGTMEVNPFELEELLLSYRDYTFSFEFTALNFTSASRNRYAYRLEGFDDEWIDAGNRRFARYTNIPAGSYVFRVKGSNNDGLWNQEGAWLAVRITPPFWKTWWFRLLSVALILALLAAAYRYRVEKLIEMERLRLRIAADLHDDLGGELSSIAMSTALVERRDYLPEEDRARLSNARQAALRALDGIRDIVWYINPEHDTLDGLARRMRGVARSILGDIEYSFDTDLPAASTPIDMTLRRNLFLIYKEALNNVVKHSNAEQVVIRFVRRDDELTLEISDDGIGFDPSAVAGGNGLRNLRRRAEQIGADFFLESRPGAGTSMRLSAAAGSARGVRSS